MMAAYGNESSLHSHVRVEHEIDEVRRGATQRLGQLLESYRNYLQLLATTQIDSKLRPKISASDLVQETLFSAYRDFGQFQGQHERQLLAWLRRILINRLHTFVQRHVLAGKRDVRREVSLDEVGAALTRSTVNLDGGLFLADQAPSPISDVIRRESAVELADHLTRMSDLHREVIVLRNLQGLSFEEVGCRLNRTSSAVRMLWLRAIRQLRKRLEAEEPEGAR
jgi:RNA polymerase sigma-70 factor (ECF subfamily)